MKAKLILVVVSCLTIERILAGSFQVGHFVMTLTDKELRPITNAAVYVKTLNRTGLTAGVYPGHYTTFSVQRDTNGVADVSFQFLVSHFVRFGHHRRVQRYSAWSGLPELLCAMDVYPLYEEMRGSEV